MADLEQRRHNRIVLVPCPYEGHLNPMLQLGSILHSKGFSITVVHTDFNSPNISAYPNFSFLKIPHGLSESEISSGDFMAIIRSLNNNCEVPLRKSLKQRHRHGEISCFIYDFAMYFIATVAKDLRLPSISLHTCSAIHLLACKLFIQLQQDGVFPIPDSLSSGVVPELEPLRYKDLPIFNFPKAESFIEVLFKACNRGSSAAVIWNTSDCLEESSLARLQQEYQVPIFPIGPLHKAAKPSNSNLQKEDYSCISWLERQNSNSVIYISLGSLASMSKNDIVEMSWGLVNSNQPFLWVVRHDLIHDSEQTDFLPNSLIEAIGDRGCIIKWAPQREVLAHRAVRGFWSHCGWNSTLESISEGVPMICQPSFGDQRVNARCVTHVWKVGLEYGNEIDREVVAKTIRKLMVEQEGKEIRQRALDLKDKIKLSLQPDGSSYNSLNELTELILSAKETK